MPPSLAPPLTAGPESCGRRALPRWVCQTGEMAERTMRAAVLEGVGKVTLQERPVPLPGPGEVLVQVAAVGTCGSDVHYYEHGRIGDFVVESPLVLGHEPSGVVVAAGPGADRHVPGQRVSIEPGVPDFTCEYCRAGRYNLCPRMRFFGTPPIDGAFCEYVVVHEEFAYPVPDSMSDDAAIRAVRRAGRVVLVGMGGEEIPLPLAHVQTRELEVTGTFRYASTWPDAIALAASGRVDLDALVTGHYGLADVEQALTVGARDPDSVKVVVTPQR